MLMSSQIKDQLLLEIVLEKVQYLVLRVPSLQEFSHPPSVTPPPTNMLVLEKQSS